MGRETRYLKYLKEIPSIKEYLKNTSKSDKTISTYLLALDKFLPFLINRFKDKIEELKDFDYETYFKLENGEKTEVKKEWVKIDIPNKILIEYWKPLNPNIKSELLMKWANETSKLDIELRKEKGLNDLKDAKNTYLNYVWRVQGFLNRLGFQFKANPKEMDKITTNGFHLEDDITYEDVIKLYEELDKTKYKLILKTMMYCGLNSADIVLLRPIDFEKYKKTNLYVLVRKREKTKHKDTQYLIIFYENFINELKEYFERINPNEKWINNKKEIFGDIKPNTISDVFKYHRDKAKLNPNLMPSSIRRLCFTRINDLFTLKDGDIYNLWTQHKVGLLTRHYITDIMERIIKKNYVEKIQEKVLIGNVGSYIREVNGLKNGINRIKDLEKDIDNLKRANEQLNEILMKMGEKFENVGRLFRYVKFTKELNTKDIEIDLDLLSESIKRAKK